VEAATRPWFAARPARLPMLARPCFCSSSFAFATSPSASWSARLQSIIPAPVASRSSFTIAAVISLAISALLRGRSGRLGADPGHRSLLVVVLLGGRFGAGIGGLHRRFSVRLQFDLDLGLRGG